MLEITTFGGLSIRLNRQLVAGLDSRKVEALLVYLACTGRAHPREVLASMLWDEMPQDRAMGNLRGALSNLRKHLAPYLDIGRDTAGVNPAADIWLDLTKFEAGLFSLQDRQGNSSPDLEQVGTAVNLYQGDFLAGFYVSGAREFDHWALRQQERMHILVVDALMDLVAHVLGRRDYKAGIQHATRWIAIDPLTEQAHQALMRLLALSGQREAALAQYEACRKVLREELGLEPTQGTRALADAIHRGELVAAGERAIAPAEAPLRWPAFLAVDAGTTAPPDVVFVGRARELEQLEHHLGAALDGSGRVVFIAGEAGRGKTALMDAFTTRSLGAHPDLLVASGHCNAYSGIGDPFLPFRDVLGILSAGVEARWSAGTISQELARRLWGALPDTIPLLVREGPELVGVFVSATALSSRAQAAGQGETGWAAQLSRLVELGPGKGGEVSQSQLFDQYPQVLRALSARHPLLIVLDDLQWADLATLTLLFHLGRRIEGSRILILGAYRPDEVALGRAGEPHPLNKPLAELQHYFGLEFGPF